MEKSSQTDPIQEKNYDDDTETIFDKLADVLKYLTDNGWKVTKPSLYRHRKEGKLLPEKDGSYKLRTVMKYSKTFLKIAATGMRPQETTDNLQRKKLEQELKNLTLKNEREKFNYEKDKGLYIPRGQMDIELVGLAGLFWSELKNAVLTETAGWITTVNGDMRKQGELQNQIMDKIDQIMNHCAGNREYELIIDPEQSEVLVNESNNN